MPRFNVFSKSFLAVAAAVLIYAPVMAKSDKDEKKAAAAPAPSYASFKDAYKAGNDALKAWKLDDAVAAYAEAEKLATSPQGKSPAANASGWALLKAHRWMDAKAAFQKAVDYDPKSKVALGNLAYAGYKIYQYGLGGTEEIQAAAKSMEACAAIDSTYKSDLADSIKSVLDRETTYAQATPVADEPKAGLGFKGAAALGDQAQGNGQFDLALKFFDLAEKEANSPKAKGSAANRQGKVLLDGRRPKESLAHFERAVKHQPEEKVFLNNLGLAFWTTYDAGLGDLDSLKKAVENFSKANSLDASYHTDNLAMALGELKELDPEAAKAYEKAEETTEAPATEAK